MAENTIPALLAQLGDSDSHVRERARHTLVVIGEPAVPALTGLLDSPAKHPRWDAAKALAEIGDPSSVKALLRALVDTESDIRWVGGEGLVGLGPRALPEVLQLLIDQPQSIDVRRAAHHVLNSLSHKNVVIGELMAPVLEVLSDTEPASAIPPRAERAMEKLAAVQDVVD